MEVLNGLTGAQSAEVLSNLSTGLWQVMGRSRLTYRQRREMDLFLVRNRSLKLYLTILLRTIQAVLTGKDGWVLTLHSFYIQGDNAWVTVNKNVPKNLSSEGGVSDGVFVDSGIQEYNIRTGKLPRPVPQKG